MILIYGSAKGPCSPKTGQKVVFLVGEKGFSKNPFSERAQKGKRTIRPHPGLTDNKESDVLFIHVEFSCY